MGAEAAAVVGSAAVNQRPNVNANDRPNIVIVMADQLTPSMLGCYGHPSVRSPRIDALAATGTVFDAAYTNSPLCTPARYCMMTGQLPSTSGGYDNAAYLASTVPTFAHVARAAGYRTVLSGKMHFVGPDQLHGFEERRTTDIYPADFGWTPDWRAPHERIDWWYHNMDSVTGAGVAEVTNQLRFDDEVGHNTVRALHDLAPRDDGRPFLLVASFTHPHDPYVTRQRLWDLYEGVDIPMPVVLADQVQPDDPHSARLRAAVDMPNAVITDDHVRSARRAYLGNVTYIDEWTGRILDTLHALRCTDDTVVIFLADHGDMLGERGLWYKMNFFENSARIPMIVSGPGVRAGRVTEPVSLADIMPTIAGLAGVDPPDDLVPLAGQSLLTLCAAIPPGATDVADAGGAVDGPARTVYGEYMAEGSMAPIVMIRRGTDKFVHCPADPDQWFDLADDPHELVNRAADPAHAGAVGVFRDDVAARWDLAALHDDVVADQARRRFIDGALRAGRFTPWDYTPPRDGQNEYMRNHLDLNDVERNARWPRVLD
jgi:choline-sulfatase